MKPGHLGYDCPVLDTEEENDKNYIREKNYSSKLTVKRFLVVNGAKILLSSACSFISSIPAPRSSFLSKHWYAITSLELSAGASLAFLAGGGLFPSLKI